MTSFLWPRLPISTAIGLYGELSDREVMDLRSIAETHHPDAAPNPVGGHPVDEKVIAEVQTAIWDLADRLGFPAELSRPVVASFDQPATRILHEMMRIIPADAANEGVWSFLSLVVLPDVAAWRFPARADERLLGRPRNVFRRLWWRAETVGTDLIDVPNGLGEDELVNIMERPTLSANRVVARALGRAIHGVEPKRGMARSELMRDASKRLLRLQAFVCMEALEEREIIESVGACLAASLDALSF